MATNDIAYNLAKLIRAYATAKVADSWRGSRPPEEWEGIADKVVEAAEALEDYIGRNLNTSITGRL